MTNKQKNTQPKVDDLLSTIDDLKNRLARSLADYSNLEKRFERDSSSVIKFANLALLTRLLELRDHLGMAAESGSSPEKSDDNSLKMILTSFDKLLTDEGVTLIETTGEFDPNTMECAETEPGKKNQVIKVQRPGYRLGDRVLRHARVTVGNGQK